MVPSNFNRLTKLEALLSEAVATLNDLVDGHNTLAADVRNLKFRLTFVMERLTVRVKAQPGAIVQPGEPDARVITLAQAWQEDGPAYIAEVEASIARLKALTDQAEAGRAAIASAVRDELGAGDTSEDSAGESSSPRKSHLTH